MASRNQILAGNLTSVKSEELKNDYEAGGRALFELFHGKFYDFLNFLYVIHDVLLMQWNKTLII